MTSEPRFSEDELWEKVGRLYKNQTPFYSLVHENEYRIALIDHAARTFMVKYESGNCKQVPLRDLYAIYTELYRIKKMPRDYMRNKVNGLRVVGHLRYCGAPGASIFGILPRLDEHIVVEPGGHLQVR